MTAVESRKMNWGSTARLAAEPVPKMLGPGAAPGELEGGSVPLVITVLQKEKIYVRLQS